MTEPNGPSEPPPSAGQTGPIEPTGPAGSAEPTEAELRAALEEQMRTLRPVDVMIQSAVSLVNLAARRLGLGGGGESERDLSQVGEAIDGARALIDVLANSLEPEELRPLRDALSQLQLEYTKAPPASPVDGGAETAAKPGTTEPPPEDGPGPAQASGRLWVPGR